MIIRKVLQITQGGSKSLEITPLDRSYTISYSSSIVQGGPKKRTVFEIR